MKSVVPVVMAGILGIYGMIVAVIIVQKSIPFNKISPRYWLQTQCCLCSFGFRTLLWIQFIGNFDILLQAAGLAIGIVGDAGVRANAQQDKIFVGMILILIFGEALALYGLIVSLILTSQGWFGVKKRK